MYKLRELQKMNAASSKYVAISVIDFAIKTREWEKNNLPILNSELSMQLFLIISYHHLLEKPLTLKVLFNSIEYSEAGIRKHLRRFLKGGWCMLEGGQNDKRLRCVVAEPKMLDVLDSYIAMLTSSCGKIAPYPGS